MWAKLLCLLIVCSGALATDELLHALSGVRGRNRASLCVRGAGAGARGCRRCDAALFGRHALLARADCVRTASSAHITALRHSADGSCEHIYAGYNLWNSRKVHAHMMHPWFDLVLVMVHRPYNDLDPLINATTARNMLRRHGVLRWMNSHLHQYIIDRDPEYHLNLIAKDLKSYHYPVWMFFMTILMPSISFMLFFIYITFYTGTSTEVPYKNLYYSKKVTQV